jgi:WD40 repeat protein
VLSPDGKQMVAECADHSRQVLSVPDGKQLFAIPGEKRANTQAYSPDGKWLAVGFHNGEVKVYGSNGSGPANGWQPTARRIDLLYFLPDSKTLVIGPADESAQVWDISGTPQLKATLPFEFGGMNACAASPDGKVLAVAGDDTLLRWYDTATWKKTLEDRSFMLETFALVFTSDGKQLLAGGADGRVTVLDAATAQTVRKLPPDKGNYIVGLEFLESQQRAAALYLDDAGGKPPHGRLWNLASAESVAMTFDGTPSCGRTIKGKLWACAVDGSALKIVEFE